MFLHYGPVSDSFGRERCGRCGEILHTTKLIPWSSERRRRSLNRLSNGFATILSLILVFVQSVEEIV